MLNTRLIRGRLSRFLPFYGPRTGSRARAVTIAFGGSMRKGTSVSLRLAQFTLVAVLGLLSTGSMLQAQVGTPGTFIGTVRDATNSAVSGAKVTAMSLATGVVT